MTYDLTRKEGNGSCSADNFINPLLQYLPLTLFAAVSVQTHITACLFDVVTIFNLKETVTWILYSITAKVSMSERLSPSCAR